MQECLCHVVLRRARSELTCHVESVEDDIQRQLCEADMSHNGKAVRCMALQKSDLFDMTMAHRKSLSV